MRMRSLFMAAYEQHMVHVARSGCVLINSVLEGWRPETIIMYPTPTDVHAASYHLILSTKMEESYTT